MAIISASSKIYSMKHFCNGRIGLQGEIFVQWNFSALVKKSQTLMCVSFTYLSKFLSLRCIMHMHSYLSLMIYFLSSLHVFSWSLCVPCCERWWVLHPVPWAEVGDGTALSLPLLRLSRTTQRRQPQGRSVYSNTRLIHSQVEEKYDV